MNLETINRLYLELSQLATAKTERELLLEAALLEANSVCRSMHSIAERQGWNTNYAAFGKLLDEQLASQHALLWPHGATTA